jgi:single-stranded DNA-specific DHH superfamily exonuclease
MGASPQVNAAIISSVASIGTGLATSAAQKKIAEDTANRADALEKKRKENEQKLKTEEQKRAETKVRSTRAASPGRKGTLLTGQNIVDPVDSQPTSLIGG